MSTCATSTKCCDDSREHSARGRSRGSASSRARRECHRGR
jgi:hypothetical protein